MRVVTISPFRHPVTDEVVEVGTEIDLSDEQARHYVRAECVREFEKPKQQPKGR